MCLSWCLLLRANCRESTEGKQRVCPSITVSVVPLTDTVMGVYQVTQGLHEPVSQKEKIMKKIYENDELVVRATVSGEIIIRRKGANMPIINLMPTSGGLCIGSRKGKVTILMGASEINCVMVRGEKSGDV